MTDLTRAGPLRIVGLAAGVGTIAWALSTVLPASLNDALLMTMVLVTVIEAEASWQLIGRQDLPRRQQRSLRLVELILAFVAIKTAHLVFLGPGAAQREIDDWPNGFFDGETVVVWLVCVGVWLFVTASIGDLERLGDPSEPSYNYRPPLQSLTGRFLAGGVMLVAIGTLHLVGLSGLADLERDAVAAFFWPAALYFLVGLSVLGLIRLQDQSRQWDREGMDVAPDLVLRWRAGLAVVVFLAAAAALVTPVLRGRNALDFAFGGLVGAASWLGGIFGFSLPSGRGASPAPQGAAATTTTIQTPVPVAPGGSVAQDVVEVLTSVVIFGAIALLVVAAVNLAVRDRAPRRRIFSQGILRGVLELLWLVISGIPKAIADGLRALWAWLKRVTRTRRAPDLLPGKVHEGALRARQAWDGGDPHRRGVAEAYRRFLDLAGRAIVARRSSETPNEYRTEIIDRLVPSEDAVSTVTAEFNEARWTRHTMGRDDVERASRAVAEFEQVVADVSPETEEGGDEAP